MILVDLPKALDTLQHGILLEKMKCFGFHTSLIKWSESYPSYRKCLVYIDCFYEAETLKYGVLQGYILGLLLFLLYVNYLLHSLSEAGSYLYAEDTSTFYQHENVNKTENFLD